VVALSIRDNGRPLVYLTREPDEDSNLFQDYDRSGSDKIVKYMNGQFLFVVLVPGCMGTSS
jgi:hypothetical protein